MKLSSSKSLDDIHQDLLDEILVPTSVTLRFKLMQRAALPPKTKRNLANPLLRIQAM